MKQIHIRVCPRSWLKTNQNARRTEFIFSIHIDLHLPHV